MTKDLRIFVHRIHGRGLLEWLPSSETARIGELLGLLTATLPVAEAESIDLIEKSTGRPIGAETKVESLGCRILLLKGRFVEHTSRQLEALKAQSPALAGFEVLQGSSVFRLKLDLPGLVRPNENGSLRVFVRRRHELLMILPGSFPETAPILVWQTPVFHPNLAADSEVWPPGLRWNDAPNVVVLIEALKETLVGLRTATRGPLNLGRKRPLNPEASSWFRKHRKAITKFGREAAYSIIDRYGGLPLVSPGTNWRLTGPLASGGPLIFLSPLFQHSLPLLAENVSGWLLGKRGDLGGAGWYYVERMVPVHGSVPRPETAIGLFSGHEPGLSPSWKDAHPPLRLGIKGKRTVFRQGNDSQEVEAYFTRIGDHPDEKNSGVPSPSMSRPKIIVGIQDSKWTSPSDSRIIDPRSEEGQSHGQRQGSPRLIERTLSPPLCMYCATICESDQDWRLCDKCDTPMHEDCWELLGGCGYTGCTRCPLNVD